MRCYLTWRMDRFITLICRTRIYKSSSQRRWSSRLKSFVFDLWQSDWLKVESFSTPCFGIRREIWAGLLPQLQTFYVLCNSSTIHVCVLVLKLKKSFIEDNGVKLLQKLTMTRGKAQVKAFWSRRSHGVCHPQSTLDWHFLASSQNCVRISGKFRLHNETVSLNKKTYQMVGLRETRAH